MPAKGTRNLEHFQHYQATVSFCSIVQAQTNHLSETFPLVLDET